MKRNWSPFDIMVMLEHHCGSECHLSQAPIYHERLGSLIGKGLLAYGTVSNDAGMLGSTAKGAALVDMWCSQPVPVEQYVDPRFVEDSEP